MLVTIKRNNQLLNFDLTAPIDISIPLTDNEEQLNCFYAPKLSITPFRSGNFIGSIKTGSPVNFMNIQINPHGNGTHTECLSHISDSNLTINQALKQFHFLADLITIDVSKSGKIEKQKLKECNLQNEVLIIRTLPNNPSKLKRNYSGTNPPYITPEAMDFIVQKGIQHLIVDLPSVDPEEDDGKLLAHRKFWLYPDNPRNNCTITELVYIPNHINDGVYLLNFQIISLEMDASPSKIVLYKPF